jgi:hypothetical protein
MDPTLIAIAYTALLAFAYGAWLNRDRPGPAGRVGPLPRYQRRTLTALVIVLLCLVVNTYLVGRHGGLERREISGLFALDLAAVVAVGLTCGALRQEATPRSVATVGVGLGLWAAALTFGWALVLLSMDAPAEHLVSCVTEAWAIGPAALGGITLFHYGLAAWLLAAGIAAHGLFASLPEWNRDRAFRNVALTSSLLAVVYVGFTWRAL